MNDNPTRPSTPVPASATDPDETSARDADTRTRDPAAPSGTDPLATAAHGTLPSVGDYAVLLTKLGEGGMGAVYLAEDTRLGRKVAIKTMRPELAANKVDRDRFVREARAAAAVEHDNIVPILHVGEAPDGTPFIAMPFLQGEPLDARLKREPVAGTGRILKVAREVADGLAAAHAKGLIHRDIKPANIWLEGDPGAPEMAQQIRRCKVLDFGLARSVEKDDAHITSSGAILGTPAYMAPEQARGEKVDHRADLFSLGVTLYRMATGTTPFKGPTAMAVLIALTTETPVPVRALAPQLPPALADLIDRLMNKDRAQRPQSAAEVSAAVRQIVKDIQAKKAGAPAAPVAPVASDAPTTSLPAKPRAADPAPPVAPVPELSGSAPVALPVPAVDGPTAVVDVPAERRPERAKVAPKRGRLPLALLAVALALGGVGVWLATRGGKPDANDVVNKDEPPKPNEGLKTDEPAHPDGDRRAAEFVLRAGGTVEIDGSGWALDKIGALPQKPFRVTDVTLRDLKAVTDADLAVFAGCEHVRSLNLAHTGITGAGLVHFQKCTQLRSLILEETGITDASLAPFRGCTELTGLSLTKTPIGDDGLAHFRACKKLEFVFLVDTKVGNTGVAALAGATKLATLQLGNTQVGDEGLTALKDCKELNALGLSGTRVTGAGLVHLATFPKLDNLSLDDTELTDDALRHLNGPALRTVSLVRTKATDPGARALSARLPLCRIVWTNGEIAPKPPGAADRTAAEYVLAQGGQVGVQVGNDTSTTEVKAASALPKDAFKLIRIEFESNPGVTDAGLATCAGCRHLQVLTLRNVSVGDEGLAHFAGCSELIGLAIEGTTVTNAGLAQLKNCTGLRVLNLSTMDVTDAGLAHFAGCKALTHLILNRVAITDDGIATMKDRTELMEAFLTKTRVSAKAAAELAGALPKCHVNLNGETVKPAAPAADPDRTAALWVLSVGGTVGTDVDAPEIKDVKDLPKRAFKLNRVAIDGPNDKVAPAGFAAFAGCKHVTQLLLRNVDVGDKGLAHFKDCTRLVALVLVKIGATDEGLSHFKNTTELRTLALEEFDATDKGLAHFARNTKLGLLRLARVDVTDSGLDPFKACTELRELFLTRTKVSVAKATEFATLLPECRVGHGTDTIKPKKP